MHNSYGDIRSRIPDDPKWFDSNGVPRYDDFHPTQCPSIYGREAVLYEIACQACDQLFRVADTADLWDKVGLSEHVKARTLHFGDPPAHGCTGDSMNCIDRRTIEFWERPDYEWRRVGDLEGIEL